MNKFRVLGRNNCKHRAGLWRPHGTTLNNYELFWCLWRNNWKYRFMTYGDIPMSEHLEKIDRDVMQHFSKTSPDTSIPAQPRWTVPVSCVLLSLNISWILFNVSCFFLEQTLFKNNFKFFFTFVNIVAAQPRWTEPVSCVLVNSCCYFINSFLSLMLFN